MDFTALYNELNILLGDSDNFTFTPEEKERALTQAINDRYVVQTATGTFTYSATTRAYAMPAGLTTVRNLQFSTTSDWQRTLPGDAYEVIDNTIYMDYDYRYEIPEGATITVVGNKKLTVGDTITKTNLQEYIFTLAHYNTLALLGTKKTNRFIKNDTNMNEIIALRRELQNNILQQRQSLARNYERA